MSKDTLVLFCKFEVLSVCEEFCVDTFHIVSIELSIPVVPSIKDCTCTYKVTSREIYREGTERSNFTHKILVEQNINPTGYTVELLWRKIG